MITILLLTFSVLFAEKQKENHEKLSAGVSFLYVPGLGSTVEEPEVKEGSRLLLKNGFNTGNDSYDSWGAGAYIRWQFPFFNKMGLEADFSYINKNGAIKKASDSDVKLSWGYSYSSFELSPMLTYECALKDFYFVEPEDLAFTFMAGPEFSFPFGKVQYESSKAPEEVFDIETFCSTGLRFGMETVWKYRNFGFFIISCYTLDFKPVRYENSGETLDLLTRRALLAGAGVKILVK